MSGDKILPRSRLASTWEPEQSRGVAECFPPCDRTSGDPNWPAPRRCGHIPTQYSHAPFAQPKLPRPGELYCRCWEPSNFGATSLRYQARMVSGLAVLATSRSALHPTDLGEGGALGIIQPQSRWQLRPQNTVLRDQIFILQEELLVHRSHHLH